MKVISQSRGEVTINTPIDDPTQFDPDWRHRVAKVLVENPKLDLGREFSMLKHDRYIRGQVDFLRDLENGKDFRPGHKNHRLAFRWSQGIMPRQTRFRLEPLLLTPVSYDVIAEGLAGDDLSSAPFITYEKLYFNIRNKAGNLSKSCHLRSYFALPASTKITEKTPVEEMWRVTAAQHGYSGLVKMWVWPDAPGAQLLSGRDDYMSQEAWRSAQALSLERLVRGQMSDFDLVTWIGKYTENEKMRRDTATSDSPAARMATLLSSVLQRAAPQVLEVAKTVDELAAETALIQDRFKSQNKFSGGTFNKTLQDADKKGVAVIDNMLHNAFSV